MLNNTRNPKNRNRARRLREDMSVSERVLWERLRASQIGFSFRRQYAVGPYILDFYCPEARLCVEVDGEQHALRRQKDVLRDRWLAEQRIETIRVPSLDLFDPFHTKTTVWIDKIMQECELRAGRKFHERSPRGEKRGSSTSPPQPSPPPVQEGRG